jgi:hypothetical protein
MTTDKPLLWQLPAYCPTCGSTVDQAAASVVERPRCRHCQQPLPVTPLPARLVPTWIADSFRLHRLALLATSVVAVLACLVSILAIARTQRSGGERTAPDPASPPRVDRDHFHIAYGVFVCDHFVPPFDDVRLDHIGIHTHGDGLIHVHPSTDRAAGDAATLAVFGDAVGMRIDDGALQLPSGGAYRDGRDCFDRPARWIARQWEADAPGSEPVTYTSDLAQIRLDGDRRALTIAFLPEGSDVPKPPSIEALDRLDDTDPRSPSATTGVRATPTTGPPATSLAPSTLPVDLSPTPTCSSAGNGPLPDQDGLPTAAQETRQRLADALSRCDYGALVDLRASDTTSWWEDAGLVERRNDHNLFLLNRYEAQKLVGGLRADELLGKPALATLYDALAHSYYCKTERPDLPWAVGDPAHCFWLSGIETERNGKPIVATTVTIGVHGTWHGFSRWDETSLPAFFVEGGVDAEDEGPLPLFDGWVGPPPTRSSYWPSDWRRLPLDR